jgi:hypothetical protein
VEEVFRQRRRGSRLACPKPEPLKATNDGLVSLVVFSAYSVQRPSRLLPTCKPREWATHQAPRRGLRISSNRTSPHTHTHTSDQPGKPFLQGMRLDPTKALRSSGTRPSESRSSSMYCSADALKPLASSPPKSTSIR